MNQKLLQEMFEYKDGNLIWKVRRGSRAMIGTIAGNKSVHGYIEIRLNKKMYKAHRMIWVYHNGDIPTGLQIDHINQIKYDNRIQNLRLATRSQNASNTKMRINNKVGFKGVVFFKRDGTYRAEIRHNKKSKHIGYYSTAEQAHEAYKKACIELQGEFACWE